MKKIVRLSLLIIFLGIFCFTLQAVTVKAETSPSYNSSQLASLWEVLSQINKLLDQLKEVFSSNPKLFLAQVSAPFTSTAASWTTLPNTKIRSVAPLPSPGGNVANVIAAWNGGAFDSLRNRLIIFGGGHGDYAGNEIYAIDPIASTVQRIFGPDPAPAGWPTNTCAESNAQGNPVSRHTYHGVQYFPPPVDRLWVYGGSLACGSGGFGTGTWTYDFATGRWQNMNPTGTNPGSAVIVSAYDPVSRKIFVHNGSAFFAYDYVQNTWTRLKFDTLGVSYGSVAIDPVRRKFVIVSSSRVYLTDLVTYARVELVTQNSPGATALNRSPGMDYDSSRDRIVVWAASDNDTTPATVYSLNLDSGVWEATTAPNGPILRSVRGTFGRWRYVPSLNAFVGVNSVDDNAYLFQFSNVLPTPLPPDSTLPIVSIVSPVSGATVSGIISVSANASDNVGVTGVQFKLDGQNLSTEDTSSPYSVSWNTTLASNGSHTLSAVARDAAGNAAMVSIAVTVNNILSPSPTGQMQIATGQWFALPMANIGKGISAQYGSKHVTGAYNPLDGRLYFFGGDYSGASFQSSYRQELYSLSLAQRWNDRANPNAGWRLEFPYCGPAGGVQPKHPDFIGWTWDSRRNVFWMVPGVMVSSSDICPGETTSSVGDPGFRFNEMMSFDPASKTWSATGIFPERANTTWMSTYDPVTDSLIRFINDGSGSPAKATIYDLTRRTWTLYGLGKNAVGGNIRINMEAIAADIQGRAVYSVDSASGRLHRYNIDTHVMEDLGPMQGGAIGYSNQIQMVWDSINKVLLIVNPFDNSFRTYHPNTRTWETLPSSTDIAGKKIRGRTMVFDPQQNVSILFGVSDPINPYMFLYRYAPGSTSPPPSSDTQAPSVPTGLSATAVSSSQINLSWSASTDNVGVAGYKIYRSGIQIATTATTSYQNIGLSPATAYSYTVVAYDVAGNVSVQSTVVGATTLSASDTIAPTVSITVPSAGATVSGSSVAVNANASDNIGVVGVQFKLDGINLESEDSSAPYSTTWNTRGVSNGIHVLTAVARDAAGNMTTATAVNVTVSNIVTTDTTPPSTPANLTATSVSSSQINLSWSASTDAVGVVGHRIYRGGTQIATVSGTTYSNTGLAPSTSYSYTVAAYDAAGNVSGQSVSSSATTQTGSVTLVTPTPTPDSGSFAITPPVSHVTPQTPFTFNTNLSVGSIHANVKILQHFLNIQGFPVSESGLGSIGNETDYFGVKTSEALKKYQCRYNVICSGSPATTGWGVLGPKTLARINDYLTGYNVRLSLDLVAPAPQSLGAPTISVSEREALIKQLQDQIKQLQVKLLELQLKVQKL